MINNKKFRILFTFLVITFLLISNSFSQPNKSLDASQLKLAIKKLTVLGSVLYIAAHPDDENTAFLAYSSKGKLLETGYLSITRGDGGQNLIGTEQSELLGIIRTQELLQARRLDGAKQFFTRAVDFGYSKTAEETLEIWGKKNILYDVVWTIRKFRPDIIITRFPGTGEGRHGNHTASTILAKEAFKLAANPNIFPEQLKYVKLWKTKRIMWNAWLQLIKRRKEDPNKLLSINLGEYNTLLGLSYTEISALSRSMHKSQGFGSSSRRGISLNYFQMLSGDKPASSIFNGFDFSWNRVKGGKEIGKILEKAYKNFNAERPYQIIPLLLDAYSKMNNIKDEYWVEIKKEELKEVIKNASGIWFEANASDYSSIPGGQVKITAGLVNRSPFNIQLKRIEFPFTNENYTSNEELQNGKFKKIDKTITLPSDIDITQPYWLKDEHLLGLYNVEDKKLIGNPNNIVPLNVNFVLSFNGIDISYTEPVQFSWTDPVQGERYRPFEIRPAVSINLDNKVLLFPNTSSKEIKVTLKTNKNNCSGILKIKLENGWKFIPEEITFNLRNKYDEKVFSFIITPPNTNSTITLIPEAIVDGKKFNRGIVTINYNHIPMKTVFPFAKTKLVRLNIKKVINNIGYIMGPGDLIPTSLETLGYKVKLLSDDEIVRSNLNNFDAIIVGIRAYNTRDVLSKNNKKLLNYVKNGGTLLVQYSNSFRLKTKNIGPYPFNLSHKRVTEEKVDITFLEPNNILLSYPNKITQTDFNNWIQERGLYFADTWDEKYHTPIASHDSNEQNLKGGLLYTKYGKGVFIYTGYSFFRQLPAGIPGAYRFFVNLISAGRAN